MYHTGTILLLAAAAANGFSIGVRDADCKDVHIFLAKGNNEPEPGRQGKLAGAICSGLKSCDYEDIHFNNPLPAPFCDSVTEGVVNGKKQITAYNKRCPDSKLVVSGYSQGAQVVGDILGGGGGVFFQDCVEEDIAGLSPKSRPGNKIVAAMVFGDTRHTVDQPFNVLSGAGKNGLFPRPADQLANLASYGDVFRNYCVETDPICAQGEEVQTHLNYFDIYSNQVAAWVKERVEQAGGADGDESSSSTIAASSTKTTAQKVETTTERATTTATKESSTKSAASASTTADAASSVEKDASSTFATQEANFASQTTTLGSGTSSAGAAATSSSTADNAAISTSAPLVRVMIGIAALLII
ncbi:related to acetylxylan esterase precursor [Fusarium torulosum]|uniref:Cutinase n=1 Tax=Fusarium torulosum TaxID=33205 RepID=A0AAE8SJ34_9HYPO|nr:related to acetylxylan esterase precursor [Fusarium torulosum]